MDEDGQSTIWNMLLKFCSYNLKLKAKIVMEKGPNALSNFKVCFHYCPNLNFKTKALKEKDLKINFLRQLLYGPENPNETQNQLILTQISK
ncbi:hypothetical protein BLOT_009266 [Blomia tropicalis]|nr:hypothetical protein BLOT_009266 [Blomia tropicalis]